MVRHSAKRRSRKVKENHLTMIPNTNLKMTEMSRKKEKKKKKTWKTKRIGISQTISTRKQLANHSQSAMISKMLR